MRKLVFILVLLVCGSLSAAAQEHGGQASATKNTPGSGAALFPIAGLHAEVPIPGETIAASSYTRELIRVLWRAGDPIDLYIIRPTGVQKPPAILFLYGFPSESDRFRSDQFCTLVTKNGYAAIGFVSALTGQRYHDRPMKQWFVSQLPEALVTSVEDVQMIFNYMSDRGDFDMGRIGMFGQGSGGAIAILSAAADARIRAVDVMDPWGDWPDWLERSPQIPDAERSAYLTPAFLAAATPLDPLRWLPRLTQPVRVQQALFNQAMPAEVRAKMEAAAPKNPGAVVEYSSVEDYKGRVVEGATMLTWLQAHLPPSVVDSLH